MKNPREVLVSGTAGVVSTAVDLGILVILVGQHVPVPMATFIASLAGAAVSFVANKYVAFRDRSPIDLGQLARFDLVAIVSALLMAAAMKLAAMAMPLGVPLVPAKLVCAAIVFALWSYPAQRRFVFARGAADPLSQPRLHLSRGV